MSAAAELPVVDRADEYATLTLNRPANRNPL